MRPYYYLGNCRALTELSTGQMFIVNTEARDIGTWIIRWGLWETFVDDVLCALAEPGGVFVDVGANMGYYTIKIGGLVGPEGKTFSFEPNPDLFEVLTDNVHINGFVPRARLFNAAAGDAAGASTLLFQRRYPGGGAVGLGPEREGAEHTRVDIQVLRIDDVVPVDIAAGLIKIDVEGFEPLVFSGMRDLLARSPGAAVVTEVSFAEWERFGDPATLLREFAGGRRIFSIRHDGGLEELPTAIDQALDRDFVSYVLMLPHGAEPYAKIEHLTLEARAAAERAAIQLAAAERAAAELAAVQLAPPQPRSLTRRVIGRLKRMASLQPS
jgi:FkbM family methyltransferase